VGRANKAQLLSKLLAAQIRRIYTNANAFKAAIYGRKVGHGRASEEWVPRRRATAELS
jgi:hypothetical protein